MFTTKMEEQLTKTLTGRIFFLKNNNFTNAIRSRYVKSYFERFQIENQYIGKFNCTVLKNHFKDPRVWSYHSSLQLVHRHIFDAPIVLTEEMILKKTNLSVKEIPYLHHKITFNGTVVPFNNIPKDLYKMLMEKSDKHILDYHTKN